MTTFTKIAKAAVEYVKAGFRSFLLKEDGGYPLLESVVLRLLAAQLHAVDVLELDRHAAGQQLVEFAREAVLRFRRIDGEVCRAR